MTQRYLYPVRKQLEMMSALFSGGYGIHVWLLAFQTNPLRWADLSTGQSLLFGQAMSLAAFVHALGIRINGHWRYSPCLRIFGMMVHATAFLFLSWQGIGSTAGYVYGWGFALALAGAWSAARDVWGASWKVN